MTPEKRRKIVLMTLLFVLYAAVPAALFLCSHPVLALSDKPTLGIPIPTINLEAVGSPDPKAPDPTRGVRWIADYVDGIYTFASGIGAFLAGVMLVVAGFQYTTAGGDAGKVGAAKERIKDALVGLLLTIGAFTLLVSVNPQTTQLTAIKIKPVITQNFSDMTKDLGFKDPDPDQSSKIDSASANGVQPSGLPPPPAQEGASVNISDVDLSGGLSAPAKMAKFCTQLPSDATFADKIQALVKVVLGWRRVCIDQKGCAYLRSGFTVLSTGKTGVTAIDVPYAYKTLTAYGQTMNWPADCDADWAAAQGDLYKAMYDKDLRAKWSKYMDPSGVCQVAARDQYNKYIGGAYESHGVFGGDCGTTLVMMYKCAGGQVARPGAGGQADIGQYTSGARFGQGKDGDDWVAWAAKDENDLVQQIKTKGGMRFGDLVSIGQQNWQHNFMYTGGRDDVPFNFFEMGGMGVDGTTGTLVNVGLAAPIGGMTAWPKRTAKSDGGDSPDIVDYLRAVAAKHGKSPYPVFIWRPYEYKSCQNKSECAADEACACTQRDCPQTGNCIVTQKCSTRNTCHKVVSQKYGAPVVCATDETCPVGYSCQKTDSKAITGTCKSSS